MKKKSYLAYLIVEAILYISLFVFQLLTAFKGGYIFDKSGPYFNVIKILQVTLTGVSLVFVLLYFLFKKNKKLELDDLFVIYFILIFIADIFFSLTKYIFVGHIMFLLAYLTFMIVRKARFYEYFIPLGSGTILLIVLTIMKKLNLQLGIDCYLGSVLLFNFIMCFINYMKNKSKTNLILLIALSLILISDLSIALRTIVLKPYFINCIISFLTWITYIFGNFLLIKKYVENN